MPKTYPPMIVCLAVFLCLLTIVTTHAVELTAGVARVDITPPPEMNAVLGGYGERMSRPAEGVHDRVFVKALVVSDDQRRFALLTADILGFPPGFKSALIQRLTGNGWTAEQILLLPSHSHTSIEMNAIHPQNTFGNKQIGVFDKKLFEWTLDRCKSAITQAASELTPVTIGTTTQEIDGWNRNRRQRGGIVDRALTVTRIDTLSGNPLAVLVNFTAHPTFMGAEHMLFSGGWPGHLQRTLEALIGHNVTVMYYNGAEGDQAPIGRMGSGSSRWEAAQQYGMDLAVVTHSQWSTTTKRRNVPFDFHLQPIDLPKNSWHPDFMETGGKEYGLSETLLEKMLPMLFPKQTTSSSLRLGNLLIVGVPGELQAALGLKIKAQAQKITGASHVTIGGLANEWVSYILSAEQYLRGGYEASVSFYGPSLGQRIVEGVAAGTETLIRTQ